jgi:hypothetical protein
MTRSGSHGQSEIKILASGMLVIMCKIHVLEMRGPSLSPQSHLEYANSALASLEIQISLFFQRHLVSNIAGLA